MVVSPYQEILLLRQLERAELAARALDRQARDDGADSEVQTAVRMAAHWLGEARRRHQAAKRRECAAG